MELNKLVSLGKQVLTCSAISVCGLSAPTYADITDLFGSFANDLEESSAQAAWLTYNRLIENEGCIDSLRVDPILNQDGDTNAACTGETFLLFNNVRELIHTANEITGDGATAFSLGSNLEGLGFALRWTAAEEYAAQGTVSGEFVNGQISGLAARMNALRMGARGFNIVGVPTGNGGNAIAAAHGMSGGSAGEESTYSKWGGFLNYSYGFGDKSPTDTEDAFDFNGSKINFGVDYILNDKWILGVVGGYSDQEVDFDASQSIVEGGMQSSGFSVMPFFMFQPNSFFVSGSLGLQNMDFDTNRSIRYPSFNPDTSSTDTETVSNTSASMTSLFLETGYTWNHNKFALEPYGNVRYSDISVDGFIEDDINDAAFDLVVRQQDIESTEFTLGVKGQYTITPRRGVYIPYISLEYVTQTEDAPRLIDAYYANDSSALTAFSVPTSELDSNYSVFSLGVSGVLRGGRQKEAGGAISGGVQGFINYKVIQGLEGIDLQIYSFGLRYAF